MHPDKSNKASAQEFAFFLAQSTREVSTWVPPPGFDPWFWNSHPGFPKSAAGVCSSAQVADFARCPSHSGVQPLVEKLSRNPQLW